MKPYPGTQTLQRALRLLELFSDERPAWGVAELAAAADLNRTTVYRLLSVLETAEWVVRDPQSDAYRLGSGMIVIGARAGRANRLRTVARPVLERLAAATGETITLEAPLESDMVIIDEISPGEHYLAAAPHVGTRWPAYATSTGQAWLAFLPVEERAARLPAVLEQLTPHTLADPQQLAEKLAQISQNGCAVVREELEIGYTAVGAPLFDAAGRPIAALSAGGASPRLDDARLAELIPQVKGAAAEISYLLGHRKMNQ